MSTMLVKASKSKRHLNKYELLGAISGDWKISEKRINTIEKLLVASGGVYLGKYLVVGYEKINNGKYKLNLDIDPESDEIVGKDCPYKNQSRIYLN